MTDERIAEMFLSKMDCSWWIRAHVPEGPGGGVSAADLLSYNGKITKMCPNCRFSKDGMCPTMPPDCGYVKITLSEEGFDPHKFSEDAACHPKVLVK